MRSLKSEGVPVDQWDVVLVYWALKKMDGESKKEWALDQTTDLPTLTDFLWFVEKRARALASLSSQKPESSSHKPATSGGTSRAHSAQTPQSKSQSGGYQKSAQGAHQPPSCNMCKALHRLQQCQEFVKLPPYERREFVDRSR